MKTKSNIRRILFASAAALAITTAGSAPALADQGTDTLLLLLAKKGVITANEAKSITSGPTASRQDRLIALLRQKGVLGAADVQALKGNNKEPASVPAPVRVASLDLDHPVLNGPAPMRSGPKDYAMATKSPLAVDVGGITITPLGFVDLTGVWRSRNTGSNLTTGFGSIPFDNTVPGNSSETRLSAQNTRIALKAEGNFAKWLNILGYIEGDFNGNDAANVFVTSNSHTFRLR